MTGYNCIMVYSPDKKRLLFCKRTREPYLGLYNLVGGHIEDGESSESAAYRELFEETGIDRGDITLRHLMDFTYYNQDCIVEVWCGRLKREVTLAAEEHPLYWIDLTPEGNYFDMSKFAGEGNIGHMIEQIRQYGEGFLD